MIESIKDFHWHVYSDNQLYWSIDYLKGKYGTNLNIIFIPILSTVGFTEEEITFSRAATKFQHLINFEDL